MSETNQIIIPNLSVCSVSRMDPKCEMWYMSEEVTGAINDTNVSHEYDECDKLRKYNIQ